MEHDDFAGWVRAERHRKLLTQEELATLAGVSDRTVRSIESGSPKRPRLATIRKLIEVLRSDDR